MLEIIREYSFDVNFETGKFKRTDGSEERIKLVQNDNESTKFKFNFEEEIADNTNVLVRIRQSTGYVKEYTMLIQNQKAEIILTNDILSESGSLTMSITLIGTDDEILTDTEYHSKMYVLASLEGNTEIPEQEKNVLVDLISQVNSLNQTASQLVEDTETAVTNSSTVLANAETALQNANTATQNANDATTNANTATQNANVAAQNANNAVTELDNRLATKVDKVNGKELSTNDYDNTEKEKNETNRTEILRRALVTETGNKIELEIDNSTYILTAKLYDKNNNLISTSNSIDLPLETMIVNATYNNNTKKIVLTLQSGSTVEFSIADLIDGLVNETTFNETIEELEAENIKLKQRISDLENNELINTVSGESIDIDDSANATIRNIKITGKSWQNTSTGKNKMKITQINQTDTYVNYELSEPMTAGKLYCISWKSASVVMNDNNEYQGSMFGISNGEADFLARSVPDITSANSVTISIPTHSVNINCIRIYKGKNANDSLNVKSILLEDVQVESGQVTDFEEYTGGQTSPNPDYEQKIQNCTGSINFKVTNDDETEEQNITFPLQEEQVLAQDDYLADDGIHHVRGKKVFDGSNDEAWGSITNQNVYYIVVNNYLKTTGITSLCSHYKSIENGGYGRMTNNSCCFTLDDNNRFMIKNTSISTLSDFKLWLSQDPITVEYKQAQEIIEPYTEQQAQAWEQIKALRTYKNITHINSEDETKPTFEVTYVRDLPKKIDILSSLNLSVVDGLINIEYEEE